MYRIIYDRVPAKFLRKSSREVVVLIKKKIEQISGNPFAPHPNVVPIQGSPRDYRLRIGNLRVVYTLDTSVKTMIVWKISPRGSAYRS